MKRKIPELDRIIRKEESTDKEGFLCTLKRGLLLALVEGGILPETEYEEAEGALLRQES